MSGVRSRLRGLLVFSLVVGGLYVATRSSGLDLQREVTRLLGGGDDRLAGAPPLVTGEGAYRFTQMSGDRPVTFNPCRTIEVAINTQGAPADHRELVTTAMEHTSAATGFRFELVGETTDRELGLRRSGPVLVAWADEDEVPELAGDVAGIGGYTSIEMAGRPKAVSGSVVLDTASFDLLAGRSEIAQAVVDHEFGHLVGLDHVDDPTQLMYHSAQALEYGAGDLAGLAVIGNVPCG